jgi:hypothetical protein
VGVAAVIVAGADVELVGGVFAGEVVLGAHAEPVAGAGLPAVGPSDDMVDLHRGSVAAGQHTDRIPNHDEVAELAAEEPLPGIDR